jgi:hypothetical protein
MRRMLLMFTVAALMVAMVLASAVPALASSCTALAVTSQNGPEQGDDFGQRVSEQAQTAQPNLGAAVVPQAQLQCPNP